VKVFIYVEGLSDKLALQALFQKYTQQLRHRKHGLFFVVLKNKSKFLAKIGPLAAQKLAENDEARVVALPDLYPNQQYSGTDHAHANFSELCEVLTGLVTKALRTCFGKRSRAREEVQSRFYPCALKHDLEMLLLAAWRCLQQHIRKPLSGSWRHPAEGQNQIHPPKQIVEQIFMSKTKRAYRDTKDAPAVLRRVTDMKGDLLYSFDPGQLECPVFKNFLDWLKEQTRVPVY
jgi:hypothetical protein